MELYITDNPEIKKEIIGSILAYQIFNWKVDSVSENDIYEAEYNNFVISKRYKKKTIKDEIGMHNTINAIVAKSNYKMIYDLFKIEEETEKKVNIYYWENWSGKHKKEYIKKGDINSLFDGYLQRGLLSKRNYQELSALNMQRIEQFIVFIALNIINLKIGNVKKKESNLNGLIEALSVKSKSPSYIVDKLMYNSRKGFITDPFIGNFEFIKDSNLKSLYESDNKKENILINKLLQITEGILPITDALKTLRYLEKNEIVSITDDFIEFSIDITKEDLKLYLPYVSKEKWQHIYEEGSFVFSGILPRLEFTTISYKCPKCSSTEYKTTPLTFYCGNLNCNFRMDRIIKPVGIPKKINDWEFNRLIRHKSTIVKNAGGGYSRFFLIENDRVDGKYHAIPQIESNSVK